MRIQLPKPFFFEEGERAVLLLHGFTGNSSDVRQLGRYLQKQGYTSYAPHYEGHGVPPEELLASSPHVWWRQVLEAYDFLQKKGYKDIAVAGLSLGGVFALKLSQYRDVIGVATMCSPMYIKTTGSMFDGVLEYAREFKRREGKDAARIEAEMKQFHPTEMLEELQQTISDVRDSVSDVYAPLFIAQGRLDKVINPESASIIYDETPSDDKEIHWYEQSGHVITIDKEKEQLFADYHHHLESLDWSN
ncbi:alpha/beta hydrolase [Macrococcus equipercicus]|uniref:Carboxylesterase n=1 Tax=Macrococcus equipercicus TaxID=69967 RepID=A0A9Q9F2G3_9STAP|nr:carboxylesterase [Macrococcus equipercicus]UTH14366.1 carboxylesterase [Macrococcus equipercicus]